MGENSTYGEYEKCVFVVKSEGKGLLGGELDLDRKIFICLFVVH
jgi:hypothetical protein